MATLTVIGGIALDYISKVRDAKAPCTQIIEYKEAIGGMAYNTAFAAAQLGINTTLVSAVGSDFPKVERPKNLEFALTKTNGQTTRSFLFFDGREERVYFYGGAYHDIDVEQAKGCIGETDWVHFAGVAPRFDKLARYARSTGKTMSVNPGYDLLHYNPRDNLVKGLLEGNDYVILSAKELEHLCKPAEKIGKTAIVTMGRKGSVIFEGRRKTVIPAYATKAKSPFGAGDTYSGTFIAARMRGSGLVEAATLASAAASFAVEQGTTTPKLDWGAIESRAKKMGLKG